MRPIPNFEDYSVTTDGRVFSHKKKKPKELKKYLTRKGYHKVWLYKDGTRSMMFVHRAVMLTYVDNPHNKPLVNHLDGSKTNNHVDNLEWVTHKENIVHAQKVIKTVTEALTADVVEKIKELRKENKTYKQISIESGIPYGRIRSVCEGDRVNARKRNYGKGYSFHKQSGKWRARIRDLDGKIISLGLHDTEEKAKEVFEKVRCEIYEYC